jgi:hypothetical protein
MIGSFGNDKMKKEMAEEDLRQLVHSKIGGCLRNEQSDYAVKVVVEIIETKLQEKEKEVNKLVQSVAEWSALAIDRKQDLDELKERLGKLETTLLSIYDYLKLEDLNGNMRELNKETFTEMLFRKAKGADSDLNSLLGLDYLEPVTKEKEKKDE